jgi:methionine--tRNA ligase beta chain
MKDIIAFPDFAKIDLRPGTVVECTKKEGSDKLLRLTVDFGEEIGKRIIFTGLQKFFEPDFFMGKQFIFVVNLEPRKMMDEVSEGMLLAIDGEAPVPLVPQKEVTNGTPIV